MTTAIITMAGFGRRFLDAGYDVPKYRIVVHGRSLFYWSMKSLAAFIANGAEFVFIVRAADRADEFIRQEAGALGIQTFRIVELGAPTDGQATTALAARGAISNAGHPAFIYNIDTFVHPAALPETAIRGEGWIPCFPAAGDAWSFVAIDETGQAKEVREKRRISPHATVGLYWFSSFALYEDLYQSYYTQGGNREMGELYVAPLYNLMIDAGQAVYIHELPLSTVIPLGVPADVDRFRNAEAPTLEA